jgi:hypothetical protein
MENWKSIVGFENYEVSDLGNVRNVKSGKVLKPQNNKGYFRVGLYHEGQQYLFSVHRLVLQTFIPNDEKLECDHINHIITDNRLENLRWITSSQQQRHKRKRKNCSSKYIGVCFVYNKNLWKAVCNIDGKNVYIGCFKDENDAGKAYNDFVINHNLQDYVILNDITI